MRVVAVTVLAAFTVSIAPAVTPVAAAPFIQYPAHPFNLSNKRLRFTPDGAGGYNLRTDRSPGPFVRGELHTGAGSQGHAGSGHFELGFAFPFGAKTWDSVDADLNGAVLFGASEPAFFNSLDTWPDATMRKVAGELDVFALAGHALVIAPLWNLYKVEPSHFYVNSSKTEFIVTWDVVRFQDFNEGYDPLGRNLFQVRLTPDGAIEMRYGTVSELDGIVGVFSGKSRERALDSFEPPPSSAGPGVPRLVSARISDAGSAFHFTLKLAAPLPKTSQKETQVGALVVTESGPCRVVMRVHAGGHTTGSDCGGSGFDNGDTVDLYLSKVHLRLKPDFLWLAGSAGSESGDPRTIHLADPGRGSLNLSVSHSKLTGNLFEVFHYPFVSKNHAFVYKELYRHVEPKDDFAIVMTDFRIDDLFNHGGSNGPGNVRIQGIGAEAANVSDGKDEYGSSKLTVGVGPVYLGPRFRENPNTAADTFRNYAFAVGWMAHELTHRWTARMELVTLPNPESLHHSDDDDCRCHWNDFLHAPVVHPVWQLFTDKPYLEASNMGGLVYELRSDGTYKRGPDWQPAMGLSALDLYAMGMIPPEEVPDTFFLGNAKRVADDVYSGEKIPVRIADLIKTNGPRVPPAAGAQHEFVLGMYLLYDGPKPRPEKLAQFEAIQKMLVQYFTVATNGKMKVVVP
jgi:hypothetical protein